MFQYSFDNKTENFEDLPARFGYRLPSDGLKVSDVFVWEASEPICLILMESPCKSFQGFYEFSSVYVQVTAPVNWSLAMKI